MLSSIHCAIPLQGLYISTAVLGASYPSSMQQKQQVLLILLPRSTQQGWAGSWSSIPCLAKAGVLIITSRYNVSGEVASGELDHHLYPAAMRQRRCWKGELVSTLFPPFPILVSVLGSWASTWNLQQPGSQSAFCSPLPGASWAQWEIEHTHSPSPNATAQQNCLPKREE